MQDSMKNLLDLIYQVARYKIIAQNKEPFYVLRTNIPQNKSEKSHSQFPEKDLRKNVKEV